MPTGNYVVFKDVIHQWDVRKPSSKVGAVAKEMPLSKRPSQQHPWTLDEALQLVRRLQPEIRRFGYHLCLGGGVLNRGQSPHDVDLYFIPLGNKEVGNPAGLVQWLSQLWGPGQEITGPRVPQRPPDMYNDNGTLNPTILPTRPEYVPSDVFRAQMKFLREDGRIDVFIV